MKPPAKPPTRRRAARAWLGIAALVIGIALVGVFGVRAWHQWQYTQRIAAGQIQLEALRGWMTLPYIARLYCVPEARLREALNLPATGGETRSLKDWFEAYGIDPVTGRQRVEAVVLAQPRNCATPHD